MSREGLRLVRPDLPPVGDLVDDLRAMWSSGRITNFGPYSERLEREASERIGTQVLATSSATTALIAVLMALDLPAGAAVVLPSFTFAATGQAVLAAGLRPVFCDVEADGNLSPEALEQTLRKRRMVRAVMAVHVYGTPARAEEIDAIVRRAQRSRERIRIVYDSAHAFGARIGARPVGTFGDAEVFSLSATKPLVACEGGFVASRDRRLMQRVRMIRNYGLERGNLAVMRGLNGKMSEIHAAIALHNLHSFEERLQRRIAAATKLRERIERETSFACMPVRAGVRATFKDFTLRARRPRARNRIVKELNARSIEARVYFMPPLHQQKLFQSGAVPELPMTDALTASVLTVPFYTDMTGDEMDTLVSALREVERS